VHASIDYRKEIPLGTREVVVRTRVVGVGRSSVRFAHDVGDGAAEASAVLVAWDRQTRRSREITADERDALLAAGVSVRHVEDVAQEQVVRAAPDGGEARRAPDVRQQLGALDEGEPPGIDDAPGEHR
jgi:hypothetical protein